MDIASIFDPLGLVGPVVIRARILLQALWREKIDWGKAIPAFMQEEWLEYCEKFWQNFQMGIRMYLP